MYVLYMPCVHPSVGEGATALRCHRRRTQGEGTDLAGPAVVGLVPQPGCALPPFLNEQTGRAWRRRRRYCRPLPLGVLSLHTCHSEGLQHEHRRPGSVVGRTFCILTPAFIALQESAPPALQTRLRSPATGLPRWWFGASSSADSTVGCLSTVDSEQHQLPQWLAAIVAGGGAWRRRQRRRRRWRWGSPPAGPDPARTPTHTSCPTPIPPPSANSFQAGRLQASRRRSVKGRRLPDAPCRRRGVCTAWRGRPALSSARPLGGVPAAPPPPHRRRGLAWPLCLRRPHPLPPQKRRGRERSNRERARNVNLRHTPPARGSCGRWHHETSFFRRRACRLQAT